MTKPVTQEEMIAKVRAAIKDRATWFALLYRSFKEAMPAVDFERLARKAIFGFGRMELEERIARRDRYCQLKILDRG